MTRVMLLLLIILMSMFYGYLSKEESLPPGACLEKIHKWSRHQPAFRFIYAKLKDEKDQEAIKHQETRLTDPTRTRDPGSNRQATVEGLKALGYLRGYEKAEGLENVTIYDPDRAFKGFNRYTSGHGPEAILMDMEGGILHKWSFSFRKAFPDHPNPEESTIFWRRVYLYNNGDLLAIHDGTGLIKIDRKSRLIWANACRAHHDLFVDEDGSIYVLTRKSKTVKPEFQSEDAKAGSDEEVMNNGFEKPVIEDYITVLDSDGKVVRTVSLIEAFKCSSYASHLDLIPEHGDVFHTNTIEVMDGSLADRSSIFKKGNILISVLRMNVIAIVDMRNEEVVWALSGQWKAQHQPTLLENGRILLLDNRGHRGMSKVIEINPFTQEIVWAYEGNPDNGFFTDTCGSSQRLPGGNTLITESDGGRAFEVTPENQMVWEFYNPARVGENDELIATLFEVVRLGSDFPMDWTTRGGR